MESINKYELFLDKIATRNIEEIERQNIDVEKKINKILNYKTKILNNEIIDDTILIDFFDSYQLRYFFNSVFDSNNEFLTLDSNLVKYFLQPKHLNVDYRYFPLRIIHHFFFKNNHTESEVIAAINSLSKIGFNHKELFPLLNDYETLYTYENYRHTDNLSSYGYYLIILNKNNPDYNIGEFLITANFNSNYRNNKTDSLFKYLISHFSADLTNNEDRFIFYLEYGNVYNYDYECVEILIKTNKEKAEKILLDALQHKSLSQEIIYSIYYVLHKNFPGKYETKIEALGNDYLFTTCMSQNTTVNRNWNSEKYTRIKEREFGMSVTIIKYWSEKNKEKGYGLATEYLTKADIVYNNFIQFINEEFKDKALPLLLLALKKDPKNVDNRFFNEVLTNIEKIDFTTAEKELTDFAINVANRKERIYSTKLISSIGKTVIPNATGLLQSKNVNSRITGALILSNMDGDEVKTILSSAVNNEKNDDTRDIIIENLQEQLYSKPFTIADCKNLIALALQRGKLSKLADKFIDEEKMPDLFWLDKTALTIEEKRFLLYRMSRSKGLNSDIEARKIIQNIDKNTSGAFSKFLLAAFTDSDCNTKFKYYMTLSAMLGGDESVAALDTLFRKTIADKRVKLAEMVVAALAMVGTNKALLSVEVISRKFGNKKPAISAAANAALEAAAEELSITKDELADRIIPNFEFDGIFKEFEVEGSTYRAFVNADFTLCFIDEDNKMRKALPKNISKELKTEFADITKEIKNVSKSQTGRLEKYLVEDRKWTAEAWQTFFLHHPIMFVYAMKLLWIVYSENGNIKDIFQCQEDTSLVNYNDEEITLEETDIIGIYHPVHVAESVNTNWNNKLYDKNFVTVFPQTARKIFTPLPDELDKSVSERFNKTEVPKGADFAKSFMEKSNWLKGTGDGGSVEFVKIFADIGLRVLPYIEGPTAWYQEGKEKAIIHQINFLGKNWNDKFLIKDVPPIIYSEVMANLQELIDAK
jgi:Domain of unknown function (DUF4132)